jgi:hypothetical protein
MGYNTTQHPPIPRPTAQPLTSRGEACFNKRAMSMGLFHSSFSGLCYTTQLYKCVSVISGFPAFWMVHPKRQVSKRQVSKCLVSKRPVSKHQVYKTSGLQNVRFQIVWFQDVQFVNFIYLLNKNYGNCQVCIPI